MLNLKIKLISIINFLIFLLFLTSSFDIFLNIKISGYSIRILYFIEFILFLIFMIEYFLGKIEIFKLLNWPYLFIWFLFIILFIPNTTILTRSIGYALWLFLSILLIGIITTLIRTEKQFFKIFDYYILSFYLIAIFGFIQFLFGLFNVNLLVVQWWIPGKLPRINGFNYEPSYFGSYLLIGWSLLFYLINTNIYFKKKYKNKFFFITLVMILSSSRMTILVMILASFILIFYRIVKTFLSKFSIRKTYLKLMIFLLLIIIVFIFIVIIYWKEINFLFNGLGIGGEPNHSSKPRIQETIDTFRIFLQSPIIGYSLGGIPSAIANLKGIHISTQLEAKHFEGLNIFVQVLAASGIFGFLFFILFFLFLFYKAKIVSNKLKNISYIFSIIIKGLSFSLFWELIILSLNQNILRPYLWIAIGMLSSSIIIGRKILYEEKINNRL